jgi:signal transduction histidine kinase
LGYSLGHDTPGHIGPTRGSGSTSGPAGGRRDVWVTKARARARLGSLAVLTAILATESPHPGGHGRDLVILVALVVTVAAQVAAVLAPQRNAAIRIAIEALGCGILIGYDPGVSAALLLFVGLDAAESLPPASAAYFAALAVVTTPLATLAASNPAADGAYGLVTIGGFLLGMTIRQSALRAEQAELRLADMERAEIERSKAAQLAERAEAAREIHDILAHNLGALIVQLDAVNALMESDEPNLDAIRPVLKDAYQHAVDGLAESRDAVSSLREDIQPLEISLRQLTEGNPGVGLQISGSPRAVPADVAFMVRRVVQESITNATKHAPGSPVAVQVNFQTGSLDVLVTDDGRPRDVEPSLLAGTGGGYGLQGMRERAELMGAYFSAGAHGRGWQVHLSIPYRVAAK